MAAPKDGLFVTNYHLIDRLDVTKERSEEEEESEEELQPVESTARYSSSYIQPKTILLHSARMSSRILLDSAHMSSRRLYFNIQLVCPAE